MKRLTLAECPKTRKEFVEKMRNDRIFRQRAEIMGFALIGDNVVFPNGMVADTKVK